MKFPKKLKYRLLIKMMVINAVIVAVMFGLSRWSLGTGFLDYVNKSERQRLTLLVGNLSSLHRQQGSFDALLTQGAWANYVSPQELDDMPPPPAPSSLSASQKNQDMQQSKLSHHRPHRRERRLYLLDTNKKQLAGPPRGNIKVMALIPLLVDDKTVGYLGFKQKSRVASRLDRLFIERQTENLLLIGGLLLLSTALLALWIAAQLVRPIRQMAVATQSMAAGDYRLRIKLDNSEEIAALGMDINNLAESLEQNRGARQRWIADIAHELRTPLAVITGEIEAMIDGVRPSSKQGLESLRHEVGQLTRLVNDLRELSNSDQGTLEYNKRPIPVAEVVAQVCDSAASELLEHGIRLQLKQDQTLLMWADEARIKQLLSNLMQNTLRYTDGPGELQIKVYSEAKEVVIDWQDSSPGVSDEELPRLTERLYRVERSRARAEGGSGLGLSIVANICAAHEGSLSVQHSPLGGLAWQLRFRAIDA